jgi:hypothetical protein
VLRWVRQLATEQAVQAALEEVGAAFIFDRCLSPLTLTVDFVQACTDRVVRGLASARGSSAHLATAVALAAARNAAAAACPPVPTHRPSPLLPFAVARQAGAIPFVVAQLRQPDSPEAQVGAVG